MATSELILVICFQIQFETICEQLKTMNLNVHCSENVTCDSMDVSHEDLKNGLVFKDEDDAVKIIDNWCKVNFCPLTKICRRKPGLD